MNLSICTISFRHQLISIDQLALWASTHHFQGIELWGIHAQNLISQPEYDARWLSSFGLEVSMLSDYLSLDGPIEPMLAKARSLSMLARHWNTNKIRTFAGHRGSAEITSKERSHLVGRLRLLCDLLYPQGLYLLVETHPNTLADTAESTKMLLSEVDHPGLRINFDVLHLWESGDDPIAALAELRPAIGHFHLKNISSRELLDVFAPPNVYAAAGQREGMVPLFEGAFNYREFLGHIVMEPEVDASLEWFGNNVKQVLNQDRVQITGLEHSLRNDPQNQTVRLAVGG